MRVRCQAPVDVRLPLLPPLLYLGVQGGGQLRRERFSSRRAAIGGRVAACRILDPKLSEGSVESLAHLGVVRRLTHPRPLWRSPSCRLQPRSPLNGYTCDGTTGVAVSLTVSPITPGRRPVSAKIPVLRLLATAYS